jgi:hypothetical protein
MRSIHFTALRPLGGFIHGYILIFTIILFLVQILASTNQLKLSLPSAFTYFNKANALSFVCDERAEQSLHGCRIDYPTSMWQNIDNELYLIDSNHFRIVKINSNNNFISIVAGNGYDRSIETNEENDFPSNKSSLSSSNNSVSLLSLTCNYY